MMIASYRFPQVVSAIHDIASTRPPGALPLRSSQRFYFVTCPQGQEQSQFYLVDSIWQLTGGRLWIRRRLLALIRHQTQEMLWSRSRGEITTTLTTPGFALILSFAMLVKKLLLGIECPLHSLHLRVGTS